MTSGRCLAGEEGGAPVGKLDDDGAVDVPGRLQDGVDGGGGGAVEGGQGVAVSAAIFKQFDEVVSGDHAGWADSFQTHPVRSETSRRFYIQPSLAG